MSVAHKWNRSIFITAVVKKHHVRNKPSQAPSSVYDGDSQVKIPSTRDLGQQDA